MLINTTWRVGLGTVLERRTQQTPVHLKHREIHVGPLYAQILFEGRKYTHDTLDVVVKANEGHCQLWHRDTTFDVDAFFNKHSRYSNKTKTSDYVSRFDVMKLIVAVNNTWNWDSTETALRDLVIPEWRLRENQFNHVAPLNLDEYVKIENK